MKMFCRRSRLVTVPLLLIGSAILVAVRPHSVSPHMLGSKWQCTRTAFVLTTCSHIEEQPHQPELKKHTVGSQALVDPHLPPS